jgi:hypothetical protein
LAGTLTLGLMTSRKWYMTPDRRYSFFTAFENQVSGQMLSVFVPEFKVDNMHGVFPDCAVKAFEHPPSPESGLRLDDLYEKEPPKKNALPTTA